MIGVLLVDDHRILRDGLHLLIDRFEDMRCVGEAGTAEEALEVCESTTPDVVLMDIEMPGVGGIVGTQEIRRRHPEVRVVVLSVYDDRSAIRRAFEAGAHGYLLKSAADTDLAEAIRSVAAGRRYLHPSLGAALVHPPEDRLGDLSEREREVLRLLALGYGNQEIAALLHLSPRTVETHRANALSKLGIATRADIVRVALEARLLTVEAALDAASR